MSCFGESRKVPPLGQASTTPPTSNVLGREGRALRSRGQRARVHCLLPQHIFNLLNTGDSPVALGTTPCSRNDSKLRPSLERWRGEKKMCFAALPALWSGIASKESRTIRSPGNTAPMLGRSSRSQRAFFSRDKPPRKVSNTEASSAGDSTQLYSWITSETISTHISAAAEKNLTPESRWYLRRMLYITNLQDYA